MAAPQRRTRASAAAAAAVAAAASAPSAAEAEQPRKRQRRAAGADASEGVAAAGPDKSSATRAKAAPAPTPSGGPTRDDEHELWQSGFARVAGVDEAGRGPLAGGWAGGAHRRALPSSAPSKVPPLHHPQLTPLASACVTPGPVVAAACILPRSLSIAVGIDDSKKMTAAQREAAYAQLTTHPGVQWAA